jgi:hypothetical protein
MKLKKGAHEFSFETVIRTRGGGTVLCNFQEAGNATPREL